MPNRADQGITGEWASAKLPPVPELKPVTVDPEDHRAAGPRHDESQLRRAAALPRHRGERQEAPRRGARPQHDGGLQPDRRGQRSRTWSTRVSRRARASS